MLHLLLLLLLQLLMVTMTVCDRFMQFPMSV